ncbi:hypothetical protein [Lysinibacillus sp. TE18511]
MTFAKRYAVNISWSSFRLGDSLGICDRGTAHRTPQEERPVGTEINHTFGDEPLFYQDFYFVCPNSLL